jgi:hypothetical protein
MLSETDAKAVYRKHKAEIAARKLELAIQRAERFETKMQQAEAAGAEFEAESVKRKHAIDKAGRDEAAFTEYEEYLKAQKNLAATGGDLLSEADAKVAYRRPPEFVAPMAPAVRTYTGRKTSRRRINRAPDDPTLTADDGVKSGNRMDVYRAAAYAMLAIDNGGFLDPSLARLADEPLLRRAIDQVVGSSLAYASLSTATTGELLGENLHEAMRLQEALFSQAMDTLYGNDADSIDDLRAQARHYSLGQLESLNSDLKVIQAAYLDSILHEAGWAAIAYLIDSAELNRIVIGQLLGQGTEPDLESIDFSIMNLMRLDGLLSDEMRVASIYLDNPAAMFWQPFAPLYTEVLEDFKLEFDTSLLVKFIEEFGYQFIPFGIDFAVEVIHFLEGNSEFGDVALAAVPYVPVGVLKQLLKLGDDELMKLVGDVPAFRRLVGNASSFAPIPLSWFDGGYDALRELIDEGILEGVNHTDLLWKRDHFWSTRRGMPADDVFNVLEIANHNGRITDGALADFRQIIDDLLEQGAGRIDISHLSDDFTSQGRLIELAGVNYETFVWSRNTDNVKALQQAIIAREGGAGFHQVRSTVRLTINTPDGGTRSIELSTQLHHLSPARIDTADAIEIRRILADFDMGPNSGVGGTYLREDLHTFMHNEESVEATLSLLDACETREQAEYALDLFGRQLWEQNTSFPVLGERLDGQWIRYEDNIRQWQDAVKEIAKDVLDHLDVLKQIQQ